MPSVILRSLKKLYTFDIGALYVTGGNFGSALILAILWISTAGVLDVESYGLISYYIAIGSILAVIGSLGLGLAVTTFVAKGDKDFGLQANSLAILLGLASGALVSLIDLSLGFFVTATIFFNMSISYLLGTRRYHSYFWVLIGVRTIQIFLVMSLFFLLGFGGILIGYALGLVPFSFALFSSVRGIRLRFGAILNHRRFVLDSYGTSILRISSIYVDKVFIGLIFGFGWLGVYTISSQFLLFFTTLPTAIFHYILAQKSAGLDTERIKNLSLISAFLLSIISVLAVPIIISNFFVGYSDSIELAQVMMLAIVPYTIASTTRAELFADEKSRIAIQGMAIFIVSVVMLQIILGSFIGLVGLAIAVVVASTLEAIYLWGKARQ